MRGTLFAAVLLLTPALTGCTVSSDAPLFSEAVAPRHPLKPGLWAMSEPGCDVRSDQVLPACAAPVVITERRMTWDVGAFMAAAIGPAMPGIAALPFPKASDYVLVDGDPDVIEVLNGQPNPFAASPDRSQPQLKPGYLALRVLDVDKGGRIDRAAVWPVWCPTSGGLPAGFARVAGKCVAQTSDAVRSQARVVPPLQSAFLIWVAAS
jgi:hypothetical protein